MEEKPKENHDRDNRCKRPWRCFSQGSIFPFPRPHHFTCSNPQTTNKISFWVFDISRSTTKNTDPTRLSDGFFFLFLLLQLVIWYSDTELDGIHERHHFRDLESAHQKLNLLHGVLRTDVHIGSQWLTSPPPPPLAIIAWLQTSTCLCLLLSSFI